MLRKFTCIFLLLLLVKPVFSQKNIGINSTTEEHIFSGNEIEYLEDNTGKLTFNDILTNPSKYKFQTNTGFYPTNSDINSAYWYKVKVNFTGPLANNYSVIEFFDQTTDYITAYMPDSN